MGLAGAAAALDQGLTLHRKHRYTREQREILTAPSTIFEYYALVSEYAAEKGLELYATGGFVKQALGDESTEIDIENRTISISDDDTCSTRKKATILRPGEWTLRDLDFRLKRLEVGPDGNKQSVVATSQYGEDVKKHTEELQRRIDEHTKEKYGVDKGPQLSMFIYDDDFDAPFQPKHYATRTQAITDQEGTIVAERIFDNNGHSYEVEASEPWTYVLTINGKTLEFQADSPETNLGRTESRTTVPRKRDIKDVLRIITSLEKRGLWRHLCTHRWGQYAAFRRDLNITIGAPNIARTALKGEVALSAKLLLVNMLSPLAHLVEQSSFGAEFRDRNSPLSRLGEKVMGATPTEQETGVKDDASVTSKR